MRIFQGHQGTVTCLSFCEENERLVSGSYDKTCRGLFVLRVFRLLTYNCLFINLVWSLKNKLNQRIFKHKYALSAVAVTNEDICITGGYRGSIKVFQISSGKLIKVKICFNIKEFIKIKSTFFTRLLRDMLVL